VVIKTQKD
jgi:hypothetical protein